jgi:hypothetical protein
MLDARQAMAPRLGTLDSLAMIDVVAPPGDPVLQDLQPQA